LTFITSVCFDPPKRSLLTPTDKGQHDPTSGKFNSQKINTLDITQPNAATERLQTVKNLAAFGLSTIFPDLRPTSPWQHRPKLDSSISRQPHHCALSGVIKLMGLQDHTCGRDDAADIGDYLALVTHDATRHATALDDTDPWRLAVFAV
jgi:hypothetical protein